MSFSKGVAQSLRRSGGQKRRGGMKGLFVGAAMAGVAEMIDPKTKKRPPKKSAAIKRGTVTDKQLSYLNRLMLETGVDGIDIGDGIVLEEQHLVGLSKEDASGIITALLKKRDEGES